MEYFLPPGVTLLGSGWARNFESFAEPDPADPLGLFSLFDALLIPHRPPWARRRLGISQSSGLEDCWVVCSGIGLVLAARVSLPEPIDSFSLRRSVLSSGSSCARARHLLDLVGCYTGAHYRNTSHALACHRVARLFRSKRGRLIGRHPRVSGLGISGRNSCHFALKHDGFSYRIPNTPISRSTAGTRHRADCTRILVDQPIETGAESR